MDAVSPGQRITAVAGDLLFVTVTYEFPKAVPYEVQLLFTASWTPAWSPPEGYYYGVYNAVPTAAPIASAIIQLRVPAFPGTYYLWFAVTRDKPTYEMAAAAYDVPLTAPPGHVRLEVVIALPTVTTPMTIPETTNTSTSGGIPNGTLAIVGLVAVTMIAATIVTCGDHEDEEKKRKNVRK